MCRWVDYSLDIWSQALASWQWYNDCCSQAASDRELLRLNLDETSICLFQGSNKGNIFVARGARALQQVPIWKRRCRLTHVAIVCDQPCIQPLLPQVVIGNEKAFPAASMAALRSQAPANVFLVRQKIAWNNQILCARIITLLGNVISGYTDRYQPILLLDASKIHCTRAVLGACLRAGIWPILVPA